MERNKKITTALAIVCVLLLISLTGTVVMLNDANKRADTFESSAKTLFNQFVMSLALQRAQASVQEKISALDVLLSGQLSQELGATGLNGTAARESMNATLEANGYIIDLITFDKTGMVKAAEPAQYSYMEGVDFADDALTILFLANKIPFMSDVFRSAEGVYGAALAVPVFDPDGKFIGGVTALVNVSSMIYDSVLLLSTDPNYVMTFSAMQPDGLDIGGSDPRESGLNLFTSHEYDAFPELRTIAWRMANETYGIGEYSYLQNISSTQIVQKQIIWVSIGLHGTEWRLAVIRTM